MNACEQISGGERGIRTLETVTRLHTFQACAFDHSATSPIFTPTFCGEGLRKAHAALQFYGLVETSPWAPSTTRRPLMFCPIHSAGARRTIQISLTTASIVINR